MASDTEIKATKKKGKDSLRRLNCKESFIRWCNAIDNDTMKTSAGTFIKRDM